MKRWISGTLAAGLLSGMLSLPAGAVSPSTLDPQTAGALMDTVLALEGVGLLAITHDLNGERLKRFDSILVLRDGALIEQGSWEALMAQRGELYRLSVRP